MKPSSEDTKSLEPTIRYAQVIGSLRTFRCYAVRPKSKRVFGVGVVIGLRPGTVRSIVPGGLFIRIPVYIPGPLRVRRFVGC